MSKRPSFGSQFERLRSLGSSRPLDERKQALDAKSDVAAPQGALTPISSIVEESLSIANTGQFSQDSVQTVSVSDSVHVEHQETSMLSAPLVSKTESVQGVVCEKRTVSTVDTVSEGFTKVPHSLLRGDGKFSEPLDFMVYLHLFTYSHGFGRRDAHMSQAQLERFTGAAKNTVKRSLERLVAQGWIKCIEEYECARMSRKWRVLRPEDRSGKSGSGGKRSELKPNTVQCEPGPSQTGGLSGMDSQTVSKIEPFLERKLKEKSENALSRSVADLQAYLATVKPVGKRESERRAYRELRNEYSEEQIAVCLAWLIKSGLPGSGATCHSPMGFLFKAIGQVWDEVQNQTGKLAQNEKRIQERARLEARRLAEETAAENEAAAREQRFLKAFPTAVAQAEVIARFAKRIPTLNIGGPLARNLAISAWWDEQAKVAR